MRTDDVLTVRRYDRGPQDRCFDLQPTADPLRWRVPVEQQICVGPLGNVFMFGGVALGAALSALETAFQQPVIWAGAQFLSPVRPGEILDIELVVAQTGKTVRQVRAIGRAGDREAFTVHAALGARATELAHQWTAAPEVPPPDACAVPEGWPRLQPPGTFSYRLDMRMPPGPFGELPGQGEMSRDGRRQFWLRTKEELPFDVSLLAVFADFVPECLAAVLGSELGGTSLDNTLRVRGLVPTRWVLCDVQIQAIHAGFAHGDVRIFAENGRLLGVGTQSINVWTPRKSHAY